MNKKKLGFTHVVHAKVLKQHTYYCNISTTISILTPKSNNFLKEKQTCIHILFASPFLIMLELLLAYLP
jgi:hypothetical protein